MFQIQRPKIYVSVAGPQGTSLTTRQSVFRNIRKLTGSQLRSSLIHRSLKSRNYSVSEQISVSKLVTFQKYNLGCKATQPRAKPGSAIVPYEPVMLPTLGLKIVSCRIISRHVDQHNKASDLFTLVLTRLHFTFKKSQFTKSFFSWQRRVLTFSSDTSSCRKTAKRTPSAFLDLELETLLDSTYHNYS